MRARPRPGPKWLAETLRDLVSQDWEARAKEAFEQATAHRLQSVRDHLAAVRADQVSLLELLRAHGARPDMQRVLRQLLAKIRAWTWLARFASGPGGISTSMICAAGWLRRSG